MRTSRKLMLSLATLMASVLMLRVNGWFGLGILVTLPTSILLWLDYGHELRAMASPSRARRVLIVLVGIPQAVFGLISLGIGLSIVGWVLYNSFWKPLPEYSGSFLSFGMGPVLALFGAGLIVDAFGKAPPAMEPHTSHNWPEASYFDESTESGRQALAQLEPIAGKNWRRLYRHKNDGSHWTLEDPDKYQERFLIRVRDLDHWDTEDHVAMEKALLLAQRGGESADHCLWSGCGRHRVRGASYCIDHLYAQGVRK